MSLASSWALFGLIWTIQLVHYPSFRYVSDFTAFHPHPTSSITIIVMPLMLLEIGLSAYLAYKTGFDWRWAVPLLMVLLIWAITFLKAIPLHDRLSTARDPELIEALIRANWPRTILWTLKALWISYSFWYTRT
jgi:hypothetical protein